EDIKLLTRHFIQKLNKTLQKNVARLSPRVEEFFQRYHWPGNVRELEHALEGALILVSERDRVLEPDHFSATLMSGFLNLLSAHWEGPALPPAPPGGPGEAVKWPQPDEPAGLITALEAANGNAALAARNLHMSPQLLHYKMKKYGLKKKILIQQDGPRLSPG
ncbi:MAG: hypothetical protein FWE89_03755, partial [Syntrophaceae bacterium]|nr:hypothetical protein [Syntrophaceae bacterium]